MKIEKITVRAGRCVPHPLHSYGNLKCDLEIVAAVETGEDPDAVRRELQCRVESQIEQHVADLRDGIADIEAHSTKAKRIERLERELAAKDAELRDLKADFTERPLLAPLRSAATA